MTEYKGTNILSVKVNIYDMRLSFLATALLALTVLVGCSSPAGPEFDPEIQPGVFQFDFETGWQGWDPIFVNIPKDKEEGDDLAEVRTKTEHRSLPDEVKEGGKAIFVFGASGWSGMTFFLKRQIDGFEPGQTYRVQFEVEIASDSPTGCAGAGGPMGAARVAGAAVPVEPVREIKERRHVNEYVFNEPVAQVLNFEETVPSEPPFMGNIMNGIPCEEGLEMDRPWRMKRLESGTNFWTVTADETGSVWLMTGFWTSHIGPTHLYFSEITVRFEEVSS